MKFLSLKYKLLFFAVVLSIGLTAFVSIFEIDYEINTYKKNLNEHFNYFEKSHQKYLSTKVWSMEYDSLAAFAENEVGEKFIDVFKIFDISGNIIAGASDTLSENHSDKRFQLTYIHNGKKVNIGEVYLSGNIPGFNAVFKKRWLDLFMMNGFLIAIIFFSSYLLFYKNVLVRLSDIIKFTNQEFLENKSEHTFFTEQERRPDEISQLIKSLNNRARRITNEFDKRVQAESEIKVKNEELLKEIEERNRIEHELIKSKDYLTSIFQAAENVAFVVTDLEGKDTKILDISPGAERIFKCSNGEVIGQKVAMFHLPEVVDGFSKIQAELKKSRKGFSDEAILVRKTGELFPALFSVFPKFNSQGDVVGTIGVSIDITARKKAEEKIAIQKRLFETMFNTIPDGVVITDTDRVIQLANRGMQSTFGCKPEKLKGKSTNILYADSNQYQKTGGPVFAGNAKKNRELYVARYKDMSGREFTGETFGAKLFDENNQWIGNLGIMRDITEREQAEIRIQQSQRMESIGNLAGGIAHDFNNLLSPIIGMAEMLLDDLPSNSLEYENAQEIYNAGKRAGDLVKQILAFSRQSEHKILPVKVQNVLKEVLKLSRSTIPVDIEICQDIQFDCGSIKADATQIHQVAMNLMTNAYHAVEKTGGKISVGLKETLVGAGELKDNSLKLGGYAILSVSDNGVGISRNMINNIFEPYFTTKGQGKGTGLGLSVVYGIVKGHKGDIKVFSKEGKGTTFKVYLPLMEKMIVPPGENHASVSQTGTENILLVDDEESIVRLEKKILERLGYTVAVHLNSIDALKTFKSNPGDYDLVITDMTMPNMTGDKLAEEILAVRSDMPVIICTGFSERINKKQAEAIGVSGFLMKPVMKSEMAQMVRTVLDTSKKS